LCILLCVEVLFLAVCNMVRHVVDSGGSRGRRGDSTGVVVENGEIRTCHHPAMHGSGYKW
jgi:hypothetical protein